MEEYPVKRLSAEEKDFLAQKILEVKTAKEKKEAAEAEEKARKEELLEVFKLLELKSYFAHDTRVSLIDAKQTFKIDSKKLKAELPDIYNSYAVASERKEYLTVQIKNDEDSDAKFIEKYGEDLL